jgi:hypothetical protein
MAVRVHRPLKVVEFNANGIAAQLQDLHMDGDPALTHILNLVKGLLSQIITFIGSTAFREEKTELPSPLEKALTTTTLRPRHSSGG